MKKVISAGFLLFLALASFSVFTNSLLAQTYASDSAFNYTTGWINGENLGFGFSSWILVDTNVGGAGYSGFYIGNPEAQGGITQPAGNAFAMYATVAPAMLPSLFAGFPAGPESRPPVWDR